MDANPLLPTYWDRRERHDDWLTTYELDARYIESGHQTPTLGFDSYGDAVNFVTSLNLDWSNMVMSIVGRQVRITDYEMEYCRLWVTDIERAIFVEMDPADALKLQHTLTLFDKFGDGASR